MWGARGKIVVDYVATPHGGRVGGVGWGGGGGGVGGGGGGGGRGCTRIM